MWCLHSSHLLEMVSWLDRTNRSKTDLYLCGWSSFLVTLPFCGGNMRTALSKHAVVPRQSGFRKQLLAYMISDRVASISEIRYFKWSMEGSDPERRNHWLYEERESLGSELREPTGVSLLVSSADRRLHTQC